jgi:NADH:ubiquinone oxidoreductase subunit
MLNYLGTLFYTKLFGHHIGTDMFDNKYYNTFSSGQEKRWVIYHGVPDPSKISAEWHGWLHFIQDVPLSYSKTKWIPNTTGTKFARNSITSIENFSQNALQCYESWSPNKQVKHAKKLY